MSLLNSLLVSVTSNLSTTLVFAAIFLLAYLVWQYLKPSPYRLPPGPTPWPIVGNMLMLSPTEEDPTGVVRIWDSAKKLNTSDITLKMGSSYLVAIHDYDDAKTTFSKEEFAGRFQLSSAFGDMFNGLFQAQGDQWVEQRRFSLHTLRDFGLGKNKLEATIHTEIDKLSEELDTYNGKPMNMKDITNSAVSNIICNLIFGHRFEYTDAQFQRALAIIKENFTENLQYAMAAFFFPFLVYIPGDFLKIKRIMKLTDELHDGLLKQEFTNHMTKYDPDNIDDFMDAFIKEMKAREHTKEQHWFTDNQLYHNIDDLFQAGTETTSTTLTWIVLYMMCYPEIQDKVRAEIHDVIGRDRMPSMKDKTQLPYTEAMITEVMRMRPIAAMAGPCTFDTPTPYKDYMLPPCTMVMVNIYAIHHDPKHWQDPEEFNPSRFIGENGKFQPDDHVMSFSVGKRNCLGESLARMEVFLFATGLLQKYRVQVPQGAPQPLLTPLKGSGTLAPKPYDVCFIRDK